MLARLIMYRAEEVGTDVGCGSGYTSFSCFLACSHQQTSIEAGSPDSFPFLFDVT